MIFEVFLVLPLYLGIFVIFFRFWYIIKVMTELNDVFTDLFSETSEEINKREFLLEKIKNGEQISHSKTPWTVEKLEKASDKVIDKLFDKFNNPPPVKINKQEALELGKPVCPVAVSYTHLTLPTICSV